MLFSPRPCQKPMIDFMTSHDRCNIFASPGTGKTAATLTALMSLSIVDDNVWPVLVVAPKRVANHVWNAEVEAWADLAGISVSKILGGQTDREAALRKPADIYTINPAGLTWLHLRAGGRWPFKTVIADESTLIKGHRCHFRHTKTGWALYVVGGKYASALVRHAPTVKRWINLTGTPTPNGLIDLWGQQWPIDFGDALGRTHSAFIQTWFRQSFGSKPEERRYEIMPGCEQQIIDRMKPTSLVIDAYDWFDIAKPVERDVYVHLPEKVQKMYNDLHTHSVLELKEHLQSTGDVTAVNSGAKVMKCRQVASGHIKDDNGSWTTVHEEKLDALSDLVDSLNGGPLLVAYWFSEDAAAIARRFPYAVQMPSDESQSSVMAAWNEGKIPMLLVHPQSAGHGLSLQHGGNNLCVYTLDWNAEYYEQVIERIGPTRQTQSGYKRLTYVHRLIAKGTWEEVVAKKLSSKMSTSEAVKAALQEE